LTGSNARLLSSEIATSLRGRTLQYEIFPLSFKEFCQFRNVAINNLHQSAQKAKLLKECETYIFYGGFPEVVLDDFKYFEKTLQEYYFVMLYRDLLDRYEIKNLPALKYFIRRILSNITKKTSVNKIYNELKSAGINVGKTSLYEWIEYVEAVYLFLPLPKYNFSPVKELSSERKYYCIDNGLQKALSVTLSEDKGNLLENALFLHLRKNVDFNTDLYYYKGNKECNFVVCKGTNVVRLIQCSWDMSDADTCKREIDGLQEAADALNCNDLWIVTADMNDDVEVNGKTVHIRPAYLYFLQE
jgi:predicted AAA+ superfamily ATPase